MDTTPAKLIELYKEMAELTLIECKMVCKKQYSCCSPEYCEFSMQWARDRGVELTPVGFHPKLLFMGPSGCVVPPHLRPMCTVYTCDMQSFGYKKNDPTGHWDRKYYDLRSLIEEAEMELTDANLPKRSA